MRMRAVLFWRPEVSWENMTTNIILAVFTFPAMPSVSLVTSNISNYRHKLK